MESLIEQTITGILDSLGVSYTGIAQVEVAGQRVFSITSEDTRFLIGPHGDTIHAIDFLVKKIADEKAKGEKVEPFLVDVNDYRSKQIRDLAAKAVMMAERARSFRYDVELSPMSAYERLIVHSALSSEPHVKTESQGEGRGRRVVIKYVE
jgi:spoIIIJ-associated protein